MCIGGGSKRRAAGSRRSPPRSRCLASRSTAHSTTSRIPICSAPTWRSTSCSPSWLARWATRPLMAGLLFSAPITLWHFPQFYQAALEHHALHIVQHLVFIATAVIMWWPILSPVPELPRASYLMQLLYLFVLGLPMSLAGALITLADGVLYPFYSAAPRVWGLTPLADQQLGGLLMRSEERRV